MKIADDRCVVFVHIPKTAGVSLNSALAWNFPSSRRIRLDILDKPLADELGRIPLQERLDARLLWGHMPYGVHEHMPRRCEYITVLREPIERTVSVYKYILRRPDHVLHDHVRESGIDLKEYIESGIDEGQTENAQTRQLSGRQFGNLDEEALETAKRNLESFLVVGLTERFEETFVLLRRALRLRMPFYITSNVSPEFNVPVEDQEMIRDRNSLDLELYAFARQLFVRQLERQDRTFTSEVSFFKALRPVSRALGKRERILRKLFGQKSSR